MERDQPTLSFRDELEAVAIGDIDQNGQSDIVTTCEHSEEATGFFG